MYTADRFEFLTTAPDRPDVTIDQTVQGKAMLLERLADGLAFPDYFGDNWDGLIDCLSDLSWVQAAEVIIDHSAVPQLSARDLRLYLEVTVRSAMS